MGSAARCRPSATWTATSRSYERAGGALNVEQTHHFRRVALLWVLANVIMLPIVILVLGPGLPPGNGSDEAAGQVIDNTVLLGTATPVALAVLVYIGYAIWAFRERDPGDGRRRSADPRQLQRPVLVAGRHDDDRAVPGRLRHGPAAGRRLRRGSGTEPDRHSRGCKGRKDAAGAGDRASSGTSPTAGPATAGSRRPASSCPRTRWSSST